MEGLGQPGQKFLHTLDIRLDEGKLSIQIDHDAWQAIALTIDPTVG
jgi:hypothetical protein